MADARTAQGNRSEAEERKRNEAEERKQEQETQRARRARQENEDDFEAATQRSARAAGDAAGETMRASGQAAERMERGVRDAVSELADQSRRAAGSVGEALALQRETVEEAAQDLSAAATSATVSAGAVAELGSAWMDWFGRSLQATTQVSQRLFQSWTPKQAAEAQREFTHRIMQDWIERNARILQVTQQAAGQALRPLRDRAEHRG